MGILLVVFFVVYVMLKKFDLLYVLVNMCEDDIVGFFWMIDEV